MPLEAPEWHFPNLTLYRRTQKKFLGFLGESAECYFGASKKTKKIF